MPSLEDLMALRERVAQAIADAEICWEIKLTRLDGDDATYTLRYDDAEEALEFPSHADAYEYVRARLHAARAQAAISALMDPTPEMIEAGSRARAGTGTLSGEVNSRATYRAMLETLLTAKIAEVETEHATR